MSKRKARKLWIQVMARNAPEQWPLPMKASPVDVLNRLMESVLDGSHELPRGWDIVLFWRNKAEGEWKQGEWTEELNKSAQSSGGFDIAVLNYLEGQLQKAEEQERQRRRRLQG